MDLAMDLIREALLGSSGGGGGGGGGGGDKAPWRQINFVDYDGTVQASFSKADFLASTGLPENPTHDGLTSEGWNWTRQNILDYLTDCPAGDVIVGQLYTTVSKCTEIDIDLSANGSPYLGLAVKGTVSIDWGDGTTPDTVTGTSETTRLATQHTYAAGGQYMIKISFVSGTRYYICGANNKPFFGDETTSGTTKFYSNAVKAIRLGEKANIGAYGLTSLANLEYFTSVPGVLIKENAFVSCANLRAIIASGTFTATGNISNVYNLLAISPAPGDNALCPTPSNATKLRKFMIGNLSPNSVTASCYGLINTQGVTKLCFPAKITAIGASGNPYTQPQALREIHVYNTTPPTLGSTTFSGLPADCVIYVPAAKLDDYKTATYWSAFASQMVGE